MHGAVSDVGAMMAPLKIDGGQQSVGRFLGFSQVGTHGRAGEDTTAGCNELALVGHGNPCDVDPAITVRGLSLIHI